MNYLEFAEEVVRRGGCMGLHCSDCPAHEERIKRNMATCSRLFKGSSRVYDPELVAWFKNYIEENGGNMSEENIFDKESFLHDISEVAKKHKLKNCVFVGEDMEDKLRGYFCIETYPEGHGIKELALSCFNLSRMYQSGREKILYFFDKK